MTVLRGEISDPFVAVKNFGGPDPAIEREPKSFCRVTVEMEVLSLDAKSGLDHLLSAAAEFGDRTTVVPF